MSRRALLAAAAEVAAPGEPSTSLYPDDIEGALQSTLASLADLDLRYEEDRAQLALWDGPRGTKLRLARELADMHERDRQPYVRILDELQRRIHALTSWGGRRAVG